MKAIKAIEIENAPDAAKASLDMVAKKLGRVPAMYRVMSNSPAVLDSYVKFNGALSTGSLGNKMAELIALSTAESNGCAYCLSAHTYLGKMVGLSEADIDKGRDFVSDDPKIQQGLSFAKKLLEYPREISNADVEPLRQAGYSDGQILEIIANVIRNMFTNYINIVSETEVDWPVVVLPKNETTV